MPTSQPIWCAIWHPLWTRSSSRQGNVSVARFVFKWKVRWSLTNSVIVALVDEHVVWHLYIWSVWKVPFPFKKAKNWWRWFQEWAPWFMRFAVNVVVVYTNDLEMKISMPYFQPLFRLKMAFLVYYLIFTGRKDMWTMRIDFKIPWMSCQNTKLLQMVQWWPTLVRSYVTLKEWSDVIAAREKVGGKGPRAGIFFGGGGLWIDVVVFTCICQMGRNWWWFQNGSKPLRQSNF